MTTPPDQPLAGLLEEAEARFELLRRQDAALGGKEIAEIRAGTEIEIAKLVVNLKNAAQWAAEYGDRLSAALRAQVAEGERMRENATILTATADWDVDAYTEMGDACWPQVRASLGNILGHQITTIIGDGWFTSTYDKPGRIAWSVSVLIQNARAALQPEGREP